MSLWIVQYHHRHGTDAWPIAAVKPPSQSDIIRGLDDWEPDKSEWLEVLGPFNVPNPAVRQLEDAHSRGWDSLEGAILGHLGILDQECNGLENVIKDLVNRCRGFKAWRTHYVKGRMR